MGGPTWWEWRKPQSPLKAEWIEMRADYHERKKGKELGNRVMLYVHGGAYYFGSVDEHRYQMQRHARKLKARVFAPEYRLAPQFPFPCGLQDCLAAYLFLLETIDPSAIVLAGDSAGGGMVMSMLVMLRDQGVPMPAGAVLISPWVDLSHSFPSVAGENPLDYIPPCGFHHKPSMAWPPPNAEEMGAIRDGAKVIREALSKVEDRSADVGSRTAAVDSVPLEQTAGDDETYRRQSEAVSRMLTVDVDGEKVKLTDQIQVGSPPPPTSLSRPPAYSQTQMYTTNDLLSHPLVSPVLQPTLGGLPPLLIMVGGAEMLRDEQIFLAHKCANPAKYAPFEHTMTAEDKVKLGRFAPTPVQLQVWDDLCHVAPTLSFTRPAKYMYRAVAQFSAWALARAQRTSIMIPISDDVSSLSSSDSSSTDDGRTSSENQVSGRDLHDPEAGKQVGRAGDSLPPFVDSMIRQRVTFRGVFLPLPPESELPGCTLKPNDVGAVQSGPVARWIEARRRWDVKFARAKVKVHEKMAKEMAEGYLSFGDGEIPPPSALAGRRRSPAAAKSWTKGKRRSAGLALWSLWGSAHDKVRVTREAASRAGGVNDEEEGVERPRGVQSRGLSYKGVKDENQTGEASSSVSGTTATAGKEKSVASIGRRGTLVEDLLQERKVKEEHNKKLLGPEYAATGVAGRRPTVDGVAVPFSLGGGTAASSMVTLNSEITPAAAESAVDGGEDGVNGSVVENGGIREAGTAEAKA